MVVRRSVLFAALGVFVIVGALALAACQSSDSGTVAPADQGAEEAYPGGVRPSEQGMPTPEGGYPEGQRPTAEPVPVYSYPSPGAGDESSDENGAATEEDAALTGGEGAAACADPMPGMAVYVDDKSGFCFQYPEDYISLAPESGSDRWIVTIAPAGSEQGQAAATGAIVSVEALGPVDTATVDDLADELLSSVVADDLQMQRTEVMIGGESSVIVDGVPGFMSSRQAFLIHDGNGFTILVMPWNDAERADLQASSDSLWQAVADSFTFTSQMGTTSE